MRRWWDRVSAAVPGLALTAALLRRAFTEFRADHCQQLAAAISDHVLFSVFPITILGVAVLGLVADGARVRSAVVEAVAAAVMPLLTAFAETLLVHVLPANRQPTGFTGPVLPLATYVVGVALLTGTFVALFRFVPATRTTERQVWPGAFVAALGLQTLQVLFSVYAAHFANYDRVYGPFGTVVAALFFVYLAAVVFLYCAQVAAEYPRLTRQAGPTGERNPAFRRSPSPHRRRERRLFPGPNRKPTAGNTRHAAIHRPRRARRCSPVRPHGRVFRTGRRVVASHPLG